MLEECLNDKKRQHDHNSANSVRDSVNRWMLHDGAPNKNQQRTVKPAKERIDDADSGIGAMNARPHCEVITQPSDEC